MKYSFFIVLFLSGVNCKGQDTTKNLKTPNISFIGGINVVYPTVSPYRIREDIVKGMNSSNSNYLVTPLTNITQWFIVSYNHLIHQTSNFSIETNFAIGYIQYKYSGSAKGYDSISSVNTFPQTENGIIQAQEQINILEIDFGISSNEKILKNVSWYNQLDLIPYIPISSNLKGDINSAVQNNLFCSLFQQANIMNEGVNLYLFYRTGVTFLINNNLSLTPLIAFHLLDFTAPNDQRNMLFNQIKPVNSLGSGIMLTYNFNKK